MLAVVGDLRAHRAHVVVDVDDDSCTATALLDASSAIVAVVGASPVGVVRALEWSATVCRRAPETPVHLAVNRAPRARYRRAEIHRELVESMSPSSITWLPADRNVDAAAWNGDVVSRGPFHAAIRRLAEAVSPSSGRWEWRRR